MTHDELQSLLGPFALDALAADEALMLEAHLADCPRCRAELAAYRETAAMLGNVGADAPDGVWDRIAAELDFESAGPTRRPSVPDNVMPFRSRRQLSLLVVAALASAAVAIGLLGVSTLRLQHRVNALRAAVSSSGIQQAAAAAAVDPNHTVTRLVSADGRLGADVVTLPDGQAYLLNSDLPPLDADHTYQLWGLNGGKIVSLGLLGADPRLVALRVEPSVSRLMITAEPEGGRSQPDQPVQLQGDRSA